MTILETTLQRALLAALPARLPWLRLYRRMVGTAEVRGATVSFGVKGQSDLYGWDARTGRHVEVELKAAGGRLSEEQDRWLGYARCNMATGLVLIARRNEAVSDTIERWLKELEDACRT